MAESEKPFDLRVKKLEDNYTNLLNILQRIEKRLLGDLEKDTPGLIYEVKQLRDQQLVNVSEISKSLTKVDVIKEQLHDQNDLIMDVEKVKNFIESYNKRKWMMAGALVMGGVAAGKIDWIWRIIMP